MYPFLEHFTAVRHLERNEFLKRGTCIDTNIYFVEKGSLILFLVDKEEEQIIRFGYTNSFIVCLDSYLSGNPSDFYIQALKKTTVHYLGKAQFTELLHQYPGYQHYWISILEDLVLQQMEREVDLLTHSPQKRYERVLQRSPQLFQEVPRRYIANYLRMSPETLSRLKKS